MTDGTGARIAGVLLAGGLSSRMGGGDKALRTVGGRTIVERVVQRMAPLVECLILNANGDPERFRTIPALAALPVVADSVEGFAGPLAGILAALDWMASNRPDITDVVSLPTDCPFLPVDLVTRMAGARLAAGAMLASVRSGCADGGWQTHPVIGLWPVSLREMLREALVTERMRKIDRWTARFPLAHADYGIQPVDPFFNANTPEELAEAERLAHTHPEL